MHKWLFATKVRLLGVSAGVFIDVVKAVKEKMTAEDYETVMEQLPPEGQLLFKDPNGFLAAMEKRGPRPKLALPAVADVTDLATGRVPAVAAAESYTDVSKNWVRYTSRRRLQKQGWPASLSERRMCVRAAVN